MVGHEYVHTLQHDGAWQYCKSGQARGWCTVCSSCCDEIGRRCSSFYCCLVKLARLGGWSTAKRLLHVISVHLSRIAQPLHLFICGCTLTQVLSSIQSTSVSWVNIASVSLRMVEEQASFHLSSIARRGKQMVPTTTPSSASPSVKPLLIESRQVKHIFAATISDLALIWFWHPHILSRNPHVRLQSAKPSRLPWHHAGTKLDAGSWSTIHFAKRCAMPRPSYSSNHRGRSCPALSSLLSFSVPALTR